MSDWKAKAAAAIVNHDAPAAPQSPDKALADALTANLPNLGVSDYSFAKSLLNGFARYGSFTDKQRPYVLRLIGGPVAPKAPAAPVVEVLQRAFVNLCGLVNLDKFARFTVGAMQLSLKNDGSVIWVKYDGQLHGVIDSYKQTFRLLHKGLTKDQQATASKLLDWLEEDPEAAAKQDGIMTGRCSCCGRPLTDPASIEIGVGPWCAEKAGW